MIRASVMLVSGKDIFKEKGSNKIKTTGINWLFKKKKIKETKKCLDCNNQAKSNVAKYCLDCSHKRAVANNSKQSLRRYHAKNKSN